MKTARWPLLLIILVFSLTIYWLKQREKVTLPKNLQTSFSPPPSVYKQNYSRSYNAPKDSLEKVPKSSLHLRLMTEFLKSSALKPEMSYVLAHLQKLQTHPIYFQDTNPSTGNLFIIRTEKPLAGTRYFHAQYFSDTSTQPFLQHMSFEIPPSKESLQIAAKTVKDVFKNLKKPEIQKEGFVLWKWQGGYNVWIMRLNKDQLAGDPFNAYTAQDEGSVRIAMELDIGNEH